MPCQHCWLSMTKCGAWRLYSGILEDDFNVITATNVKQAETILEREWIQLLLCDQRMPETTGVSFSPASASCGPMWCA